MSESEIVVYSAALLPTLNATNALPQRVPQWGVLATNPWTGNVNACLTRRAIERLCHEEDPGSQETYRSLLTIQP